MASKETKTPYELQRDERIAQNRKILADMGLAEAWRGAQASQPPTKKAKSVKVKREAKPAPPRQSARLHPELKKEFEAAQPLETTREPRKRAAIPAKRLAELEETDAEAVYRHNLMRVNSMSKPAMQRRIGKIKRVDKMESLILVLRDMQEDELLKQAEEALKELQQEQDS